MDHNQLPPGAEGPLRTIEEPGIKADGDLLQTLRREVAELLGRNTLKFPGAQPVSFGARHIEELSKQDYYVCEKSDGIRYLLYLTHDGAGNGANYFIDRKNDFWFIPNHHLRFPLSENPAGFHQDTILDGELVIDTLPDGRQEPRYLVFDCLIIDKKLLVERTLDKRIAYVKQNIYDPYKKALASRPDMRPLQPFILQMKDFQFSYAIDMLFATVLPNLPHGNDGLIFTCRNTSYKHGTDEHILKWKPPEENTLDCRLKLHFPKVEPTADEMAEGITEPFVDYDSVPSADLLIFAGRERGVDQYDYFNQLYITEEEWETLKSLGDPLDDRIVECNLDDQGRWRIVRFRDDKTEANHRSTMDSVLSSIHDRVTEKDLQKAAPEWKVQYKARAEEAKRAAKR